LVGGLNEKPQSSSPTNSVQITSPKQNFSTIVPNTAIEYATNTIITIGTQGVIEDFLPPPLPPEFVPDASGSLEVSPNSLGFLNIRTLPSSSSGLIRKAKIGEKFDYVELQDGWYKIVLSPDKYGWVSGKYIQVVLPTP